MPKVQSERAGNPGGSNREVRAFARLVLRSRPAIGETGCRPMANTLPAGQERPIPSPPPVDTGRNLEARAIMIGRVDFSRSAQTFSAAGSALHRLTAGCFWELIGAPRTAGMSARTDVGPLSRNGRVRRCCAPNRTARQVPGFPYDDHEWPAENVHFQTQQSSDRLAEIGRKAADITAAKLGLQIFSLRSIHHPKHGSRSSVSNQVDARTVPVVVEMTALHGF